MKKENTCPEQDKKITVFLLIVCVIQMMALVYYLNFFRANGYLPSPFIYDKADTFMDLYNPMFWAYQEDRYSEWRAVYPPLNFLILKWLHAVFDGGDVASHPLILRKESVNLQIALCVAYLAAPLFTLTRAYWRTTSGINRILIYAAFTACAPMLFALERGNLIVVSLFFIPVLFADKPLPRLLALAVLANLKPYFILLWLAYAAKRRWNDLCVGLSLTLAIYLLTSVMLGSSPLAIPLNILAFAQQAPFSPIEVISMPSSVGAFSYVLASEAFQKGSKMQMATIDALIVLIDLAKNGMLALALFALLKARNTVSLRQACALVLVLIPNMGISVGGYTMAFYLVLLPFLYETRLRWIYCGLITALALPFDCITLLQDGTNTQLAYLSGKAVIVKWQLGLGSLVRPALNGAILTLMSLDFMCGRHNENASKETADSLKIASQIPAH
jgi:hypothetical protein